MTEQTQFTEDQKKLLEEINKNPLAYWTTVHEKNMSQVLLLEGDMRNNLTAHLGKYIHAFKGMLSAQSQELIIHRTLESIIRSNAGGEKDINEYIQRLDELREGFKQQAEAFSKQKQEAVAVAVAVAAQQQPQQK
jgi:predicted nucleotide-binding protein (sugar kinase/HSP70/actin superfamily)